VGSCLSNQVWRMRFGELLAILLSETVVGGDVAAVPQRADEPSSTARVMATMLTGALSQIWCASFATYLAANAMAGKSSAA
jgi:hypothetical protein